MIVFEHPEALLTIPLIIAIYVVAKAIIGKRLYKKIHVIEHPLIDYIEPVTTKLRRENLKELVLDAFSLLSIILIVFALASPINQYTIVQRIETKKIGTLEIKVKSPVVLVLDNSGSMGGEKIEIAKKALLSFIDKIDHKLDIGLVVFNGVVDIAIPPTPNITRIKKIIPTINATDGTMYTYPLNIVYQWLKPYREFNVPVFVVFASDGLPADSDQALLLIKKYSAEKIPIYSIFIGKEQGGYEFLKQMSEETGGEAFLADQIDKLVDKFNLVADKILNKVEANISVKLTYNITRTVRENLSIYFEFASLCLLIAYTLLKYLRYNITF